MHKIMRGDHFAVIAGMIPCSENARIQATNEIYDAIKEELLPDKADWTYGRVRKEVKNMMKFIEG